MAESLDVLSREKFANRLAAVGLKAFGIVSDLRRLTKVVRPADVPGVVADDADDDHVLACAVAAQADLIVFGDRHLLNPGSHYQGIAIVSPAKAVERLAK